MKKGKDDALYLISNDPKVQKMLVREIAPEVFSQIKGSQDDEVFSYIKKSKINPSYLGERFFKGEFITWSAYERAPYVRLTEDFGPVYDEVNYRKLILLN